MYSKLFFAFSISLNQFLAKNNCHEYTRAGVCIKNLNMPSTR